MFILVLLGQFSIALGPAFFASQGRDIHAPDMSLAPRHVSHAESRRKRRQLEELRLTNSTTGLGPSNTIITKMY